MAGPGLAGLQGTKWRQAAEKGEIDKHDGGPGKALDPHPAERQGGGQSHEAMLGRDEDFDKGPQEGSDAPRHDKQ